LLSFETVVAGALWNCVSERAAAGAAQVRKAAATGSRRAGQGGL